MAKKKMTETQTPSLGLLAKVKADKVEIVNLSQIDTESFENSRSGKWSESTDADETRNELKQLRTSIEAKGQTTAVFVRPSKGAIARKKPYQLIAGFRRAKVLQNISDETKQDVQIKIINKGDISDYEARALNIEENTARDDLSGPDLAWAIYDLANKAIAAGMALSDVRLAEDQGISQAYGNRLLRIMRKVSPKLTASWRKDAVSLTVPEMDQIADIEEPGKQKELYDKLLGKRVAASGEGSARGPGAWVETAKKSGIALGEFLALAETDGLIELKDLKFDAELVKLFNACGLIKFGKNPTDAQLGKVASAINASYSAAPDKRTAEQAEAANKAAEAAAKGETGEKPTVKRRGKPNAATAN